MKIKNLCAFISSVLILFGLSSCYSVFDGGTGGTVADAESNSSPKAGIPNVNVYAYTKEKDRNADFDAWCKGSEDNTFVPAAKYYGHTTTGADGNWTISKLVWKTAAPNFGKDADYSKIYLIFYHEDYGCTKSETIILSDSTSDYTYVGLTSIVKRTNLTLNFVDAADNSQTSKELYVEVSVPQATDKNPSAKAKVYKANVTGSGIVQIRYPRYVNSSGTATYSKADTENTPEISVNYYQAVEDELVEWKACNYDFENDTDYSFLTAETGRGKAGISKTVKNSPYSMTFFGKKCRISMPSVYGTYGDTGNASSDGVEILLKGKDSEGNYTENLGSAITAPRAIGTNGTLTHGNFSGLGGSAYFWTDYTYTGKCSKKSVQIQKANGTPIQTMEIDSLHSSYEMTLN